MASIRFMGKGYKILGDKDIKEPKAEITDVVREHIKEFNNPNCIYAFYWSDEMLRRNSIHPYTILTEEYQNYLISIGEY